MLKAKKIESKSILHEDIIVDNYKWMDDLENNKSDIMSYVESEQQFTKESLKHTEDIQKDLVKALSSRLIRDESIIYTRSDEYFYYYKKAAGVKLNSYYRKKGENGQEELVLDFNKVDNGNNYSSIHNLKVSFDHKFIAYLIDKNGSEICELYIQEITSGNVLEDTTKPDCKAKSVLSYSWASNNIIIYSSLNTETNLFQLTYRHELFTPAENDILMFKEFENLESNLNLSGCKKYITNSPTTCGDVKLVQYLNLNNPYGDFITLAHYEEGKTYDVTISNDSAFLILYEHENSEIVLKDLSDEFDTGTTVYTTDKGNSIARFSLEASSDFIFFLEKKNGQNRIKVINITSRASSYIEFPEDIYFINIDYVDFKNNSIRLQYSSFKTPLSIIEINLATKERVVLRKATVKDYISDDFVSERVFAKADDGTQIPITLFYKNTIVNDGNNPLYLCAYGNYGYNIPMFFDVGKLVLAEKGVVYAVAHVRGGGFYGKEWHNSGKKFNKRNSFTDLISCSEYLIEEKYTDSSKLVIKGESAGGALVLGAANMRPDLFKVVIPRFPMAEILGQMTEESKWAFKEWHYDEWGNPAVKDEYEYLKSWCPYYNIKSQAYPHMLITAGLNDTRVDLGVPLKYVAKLREYKQNDSSLLFDLTGSGHSSTEEESLALEFAFVFDKLGVK
jgi:oligopeptidase B